MKHASLGKLSAGASSTCVVALLGLGIADLRTPNPDPEAAHQQQGKTLTECTWNAGQSR